MSVVERFKRMEARRIPDGIDYGALRELSGEAREKLAVARPASLGQAGRIAGVSPADIAVLVVHLERAARSSA